MLFPHKFQTPSTFECFYNDLNFWFSEHSLIKKAKDRLTGCHLLISGIRAVCLFSGLSGVFWFFWIWRLLVNDVKNHWRLNVKVYQFFSVILQSSTKSINYLPLLAETLTPKQTIVHLIIHHFDPSSAVSRNIRCPVAVTRIYFFFIIITFLILSIDNSEQTKWKNWSHDCWWLLVSRSLLNMDDSLFTRIR